MALLFFISFACAALEFRLSPNTSSNQIAIHIYSNCHPYICPSPRYHYHIRRFWDVWMAVHRRHFMQRTWKSTPYKQSKFTGNRLCRRPLDYDGRILRGFEPSVGPLVSPLAPPINQIYEDSMDLRRFPGRVSGCLDFVGFRRIASPPLDLPIHQIYEDSID